MFPSSFNVAKVNSWCHFSASTSNFISWCIAKRSCLSDFIIISCCDFSKVIRLSCSSIFRRFSPSFRPVTVSPILAISCLLLYAYFSLSNVWWNLRIALCVGHFNRAGTGRSFWRGWLYFSQSVTRKDVSETNLGFTLSLNPRKESMRSKNSNFLRPLPVFFLLLCCYIYQRGSSTFLLTASGTFRLQFHFPCTSP